MPAFLAAARQLGDAGRMGKLAQIALLLLFVGGCVQRKVTVEPFQPAEVAADGESPRRAFVTMKWFGLDPVVDAGEAYGADAPLSTQPMGRSRLAAELAADIGVRPEPPPPPAVVETPTEAPPAAID